MAIQNIAVVAGGYSGESVISLQSAENVINNIDKTLYTPYKVIITEDSWYLEHNNTDYTIDKNDFSASVDGKKIVFDAVFLIIHGTPGEDGKLQGYFDMLNIPYTACSLQASAITFNKEICKNLLKPFGIKTANAVTFKKGQTINSSIIIEHVNFPCFVKTNTGGSSIGASKVTTEKELMPAVEKAFEADNEIIIEDYITGTEVTCGVTTFKGKPKALSVTEIVSHSDFFDFDAKYINKATEEITPARIPENKLNECLRLSEYIYQLMNCKGMIRIDYFLSDNEFYLIEVNTIPGLSNRSLIPQQAAYCGLTMTELITSVIMETTS